MPLWLKASGIGGSILALIALAIVFFKQLIAFIGFLTFAIKAIIVIVFIALFAGIGYMIFRTMKENQKKRD